MTLANILKFIKMTAQEAHDIAISMSPKLLANLLECIKQTAQNGQFQYQFSLDIPNEVLDELRHLGYRVESGSGITIFW